MIQIKSIYTKAAKADGRRILVELFWPEGLKTREAHVDEWLSELGPSYDLQRFHLDHNNWEAYKSMFAKEVLDTKEKKALLEKIYQQSKNDSVTLLYGNKNPRQNHAAILKELIEDNFDDN
ncbi:MAG: DUF488 domain-containing protein [bacterium]